ncbi:SDR family NAD(P)-dependent oxidoreductase [Catenovulum sp. SM1970]|uniref:SDR family NAD(P)-dependent oxidoreductase n=1 Tax=Marinifaba aquimaris TaxID=2741323 RepID=UPI0015724A1F|nr:SDR family NAD(P)-dependent oxidoreductase [Marinifaba aquimaris]NTS75431.1 SDR family NAD(P)-dependent oxidoreductase [Marinifaba aquimaris]
MKPVIVIIGATSGIADALLNQYAKQSNLLVTISRHDIETRDNHVHFSVNYQNGLQDEIAKNTALLSDWLLEHDAYITRVFICTGMLHDKSKGMMPEKSLAQCTEAMFVQLYQVNTILPITWLQSLTPLLKHKQACVVSVFSARVGSIEDNQLGGWHAYRASKAALNMLLKNVAIEWARTHKNCKLVAFHPGTTDTKLSEPFQKNVPEGKLFTTEFVATQLLTIIDNIEFDNQLSYLDWQGKSIKY